MYMKKSLLRRKYEKNFSLVFIWSINYVICLVTWFYGMSKLLGLLNAEVSVGFLRAILWLQVTKDNNLQTFAFSNYFSEPAH